MKYSSCDLYKDSAVRSTEYGLGIQYCNVTLVGRGSSAAALRTDETLLLRTAADSWRSMMFGRGMERASPPCENMLLLSPIRLAASPTIRSISTWRRNAID